MMINIKVRDGAIRMLKRFQTEYGMELERAIAYVAVATMIPIVELEKLWHEHQKEEAK